MTVKLENAQNTMKDRYLKEFSAIHSRQVFNWENEKCCLNKSSKASVSTNFRAFIASFLKGYFPI